MIATKNQFQKPRETIITTMPYLHGKDDEYVLDMMSHPEGELDVERTQYRPEWGIIPLHFNWGLMLEMLEIGKGINSVYASENLEPLKWERFARKKDSTLTGEVLE